MQTHPTIVGALSEYFTWWQGLLALLLVAILIAYKMWKSKQM